MKTVENEANRMGAAFLDLMENAGTAAFNVIRKQNAVENMNCSVFCGKGNNGGDGFVVARKLSQMGANVLILLTDGIPQTTEAYEMYLVAKQLDIHISDADVDLGAVYGFIKKSDIIVDAVYGTGFKGALSEKAIKITDIINASKAQVYALDIPSGVSADECTVDERAVRADCTIVFDSYKYAHVSNVSKHQCGRIELKSIGIPEDAHLAVKTKAQLIDEDMVFSAVKKRRDDANKGTYGKLMNVSGSFGMTGAAVMSTKAALRVGTGLVTAASPESLILPLAGHLVEATMLPLPETEGHLVASDAHTLLAEKLQGYSACLIGCGMGVNDNTHENLTHLIRNCEKPLIIDADGINLIARNINILKERKAPVILTPHMGEMARLLECSVQNLQRYKLEAALKFAKKFGVVLVLKDYNTVVTTPDGRLYFNSTGNPGLAKGGSGDILAGMIAGFAAQGIDPAMAACAGVYLHGLAADRCALRKSQYGMLPTDILDDLCAVFLEHQR